MAVIVVNALTLQRDRHPAPFFVESGPATAAAVKPAIEHPAPVAAAVSPPISHPTPPLRPPDPPSRPEPASNSRPIDPIGDMLRSDANKDAQRLQASALAALVKLGYSMKTGDAGGAEMNAALRDFEKAHGLPVSTEVTPHLVKLLTAAVNSSTSR
jgi:hypothetical protein